MGHMLFNSLFLAFLLFTLTHQLPLLEESKNVAVTPQSSSSASKAESLSTLSQSIVTNIVLRQTKKLLSSTEAESEETSTLALLPTSSNAFFTTFTNLKEVSTEKNVSELLVSASTTVSSALTSNVSSSSNRSPITTEKVTPSYDSTSVENFAVSTELDHIASTNKVLASHEMLPDLITSIGIMPGSDNADTVTATNAALTASIVTGTSEELSTLDVSHTSSSNPTTDSITEIVQSMSESEKDTDLQASSDATLTTLTSDVSTVSTSTEEVLTLQQTEEPELITNPSTVFESQSTTQESFTSKSLPTTAQVTKQQTTHTGKSRKRPGVLLEETSISTPTSTTKSALKPSTSTTTVQKSTSSKVIVSTSSTQSSTTKKDSTTLTTEANEESVIVKYGAGRTIGFLSVIIAVLVFSFCCICRYNKRRKYGKLRQFEDYHDEDAFLMNSKGKRGLYQSDRFGLLDEDSENELL